MTNTPKKKMLSFQSDVEQDRRILERCARLQANLRKASGTKVIITASTYMRWAIDQELARDSKKLEEEKLRELRSKAEGQLKAHAEKKEARLKKALKENAIAQARLRKTRKR